MKCAANPTERNKLEERVKINLLTQGKEWPALLTLKGGLESLGLAEKSKEMMRSTPL